ncbi:Outer membrane protein TolC [Hymenobacter psychrotolerans DSM 18569]|uniref:Outer membrane protein TolC n=1 Tax=Hymenobacter psychrotolerans DSM 18569 TaxID=1121959 RepID=A0A1M7H041_9BACT|nr:Outer membrane protein TolC [Hymenobacter psychrotolerans DSM 18569]
MRITRVTLVLCLLLTRVGYAQTLSLPEAISKASSNYGSLQAKESYRQAAEATVQERKRDYLPDLRLSAQQAYGTVNGQHGPLYGFGGLGVASTALPLPQQDWNAGFGALYLANVNWDVFTFGRVRQRTRVAESEALRAQHELEQAQFEHQVRVAANYLNLLTAQRLLRTREANLARARVFKSTTVARTKSGLVAGVDSSLAAAEVSNARTELLKTRDLELDKTKALAVLLGVPYAAFQLDSAFITRTPGGAASLAAVDLSHPVLRQQQSRIAKSEQETQLQRQLPHPTVSLFGVVQGRGSGFEANYPQDQTAFSRGYADGVGIGRVNYLTGLGMSWNLTSYARNSPRVKAQQLLTQGLQQELALTQQELQAQSALADEQLANAVANQQEAAVQVKAAAAAYRQKTALYKNGLTTIVDVTQTLYTLSRAESEQQIAHANVWLALLLKAAAVGDLSLLLNQITTAR